MIGPMIIGFECPECGHDEFDIVAPLQSSSGDEYEECTACGHRGDSEWR